jgi:DNA-binding IclR family transcriptional regulator
MGFSLRLGSIIDICSSGSGIVFLSFLSEEKRQSVLDRLDATPEEKAHALSHVEATRERGYYVGESPQIKGVTNISVPIFGVLGDVLATITIPYMTLNSNTVHHHIEDLENTKRELIELAGKLNQNLS